ncbi:hypothetical protein Cgig2_017692 [Carnegiea gigantea]|uniref:Uncharacterized protein n=1 Tax=Carnegiea gigantea TaxID=171969 RepID=A0A9Q1GJD3_9CARY|nr:hypothetical protein Cgig2_017692 [Carnegiea gigantea]
MLAGFKSRWMIGLGFVPWRKARAAATSQQILNLSYQSRGGVSFFRNSLSSKLPLSMYSYTRQLCSGTAPRSSSKVEDLYCNSRVMQFAFVHSPKSTHPDLKFIGEGRGCLDNLFPVKVTLGGVPIGGLLAGASTKEPAGELPMKVALVGVPIGELLGGASTKEPAGELPMKVALVGVPIGGLLAGASTKEPAGELPMKVALVGVPIGELLGGAST